MVFEKANASKRQRMKYYQAIELINHYDRIPIRRFSSISLESIRPFFCVAQLVRRRISSIQTPDTSEAIDFNTSSSKPGALANKILEGFKGKGGVIGLNKIEECLGDMAICC